MADQPVGMVRDEHVDGSRGMRSGWEREAHGRQGVREGQRRSLAIQPAVCYVGWMVGPDICS